MRTWIKKQGKTKKEHKGQQMKNLSPQTERGLSYSCGYSKRQTIASPMLGYF